VEVHSPQEVRKLSSLPSWIIVGINNRNLKNFQVDLSTTRQILNLLPRERLVISESGIRDVQQIRRLKEAGVSAFLVGEAILRSKNPAEKLRELSHG
jgi:indole-3-glycerol phosphate synthase